MCPPQTTVVESPSPDREERVHNFLARHGGVSVKPSSTGGDEWGSRGWSEVYAADGHTLRCDWSRSGGLTEMQYIEIAPP